MLRRRQTLFKLPSPPIYICYLLQFPDYIKFETLTFHFLFKNCRHRRVQRPRFAIQ